MASNLFTRIIEAHLQAGEAEPGMEVSLKIDQTLCQDTTGTTVCLAFETLGLSRVRTKASVFYVDHNTLQTGFENADDHLFLQTFARRYGCYFSRPGNGICHKVHYERFAVPGQTLLGSDSHTPTSGALGMVAIGAGGMSVAMAMAGKPFPLSMPTVTNVVLKGRLNPGVTAKDVALELLSREGVKGGVGRVFEYTGPALAQLDVAERATLANMGTELGLTTSVFPSDEMTRRFLRAQDREDDWVEMIPDPDASYDHRIEIDLSAIEPMVAEPHSPDAVTRVSDRPGISLDQVFIGSCTNASYSDLAKAAAILDGNVVHDRVSLVVSPGSKQVLQMISRDGTLRKLVAAGARILECACGPCVGVGQAPCSNGVSLRTSNRNFKGRSATADAGIYLSSPEVAAASALTGELSDPRDVEGIGEISSFAEPDKYEIDDRMIVAPPVESADVEIRRGPNIVPLSVREGLRESIAAPVLIKLGDNVTTDDILPAYPEILKLRSNLPEIAKYVFCSVDSDFSRRANDAGNSIILGGENYGQGSSREHAALAPMHLGVQAVIAKSFARIHKENLVNFGILPLVFARKHDFDWIDEGDMLAVSDVNTQVRSTTLSVQNRTKNAQFLARLELSVHQIKVLLAGGLLSFERARSSESLA
jgi:aconitate hydratase